MSAPTLERPPSPRHPNSPDAARSLTAAPRRFAAWRGSWALALRMARRDARRHRGRSALAMLMILVPTALLSFALTIAATNTITGAEKIPGLMGDGQAFVMVAGDTPVDADPWFSDGWSSGGDRKGLPIPGYVRPDGGAIPTSDPTPIITANTQAIAALTGGRATALLPTQLAVQLGDRRVDGGVLLVDQPQALTGRLTLVDGRWPTGAHEVLVTRSGARIGLPTSGTVNAHITPDDAAETTPLTVVGTVESPDDPNGPLVVAALATWPLAPGMDTAVSWVIHRPTPVTWAELQDWGRHSIRAASAQVLRDPPPLTEVNENIVQAHQADANRERLLVVAGGTLLLLSTTLLVGPSFAVGASRSRRTLAIAASNGAETNQLRRTVLGQAVVLGVAAALLGTALGAVAALAVYAARIRFGLPLGPFELPWLQLAAVTLAASVSALVAALLPARRLGRLDIVGVMRGQVAAARPSRWVFVIGAVLAALGAVGVFQAVAMNAFVGDGVFFSSEYVVGAATVLLVVGALMLVPTVLHLVARLGSRMPLAIRLAARDLDRHRARSAPAVAAVVGVVSAFTVLGIGLTSDTAQRERDYQPTNLVGEGTLFVDPTSPDPVATVRSIAPQLTLTPVISARGAVTAREREPFFEALAPGCQVAAAARGIPSVEGQPMELVDSSTGAPTVPTAEGSVQVEPRCQRLGLRAGAPQSMIASVPADEIVRRFALTGADAAAVRAGAGVLWGPKATMLDQGRLTLVWGSGMSNPSDGSLTDVREGGRARIPVVTVQPSRDAVARFLQGVGLFVPTSVITQAGVPTRAHSYLARDASGAPISQETAERIASAFQGTGGLVVERGFVREDALVMAIVVGIMTLLMLVVGLTTTALSVAEQQQDQATFAALGATRRTRRDMAAAAAWVTTLLGALLGMAVGWVPGVAIAYPLTRDGFDPVTGAPIGQVIVAIPWAWFAGVLIGVPLVAAGLAWVGIRRDPQVTRRAT